MMNNCVFCMTQLEPGMEHCPACGRAVQYQCPDNHLQPGTVLNGRLLLGAALGEGGFGITYIAQDLWDHKMLAVKEFYPKGFASRNSTMSATVHPGTGEKERSFFENGKKKFLHEAQILMKLAREPGIVQVRGFFESNNTAYLVMEYLKGETLKEHLASQGTLSFDEAYRLLRPMMESLAKVHAMGLIHRDISPDNIMLTESGVKLLDFGAARDVFAGDEHSLTVLMKPGYTPQEQYSRRGSQGAWTDVYAVCATLYKCITGKTPLDAISRRTETLKPPSKCGETVDPAFEAVLMKGLEVYPEDRYASMEALMEAFDDSLNPQPTLAAPLTAATAATLPPAPANPFAAPAQPATPAQPVPPATPEFPTPAVPKQKKTGSGGKAAATVLCVLFCAAALVLGVLFGMQRAQTYETQQENEALKAQLAQINGENSDYKSGSQKLRDNNDTLQAENDELRAANAEMQTQNDELKEKYKEVKGEYDTMKEDYNTLFEESAEKDEIIAALQENVGGLSENDLSRVQQYADEYCYQSESFWADRNVFVLGVGESAGSYLNYYDSDPTVHVSWSIDGGAASVSASQDWSHYGTFTVDAEQPGVSIIQFSNNQDSATAPILVIVLDN